MTERVLVVAAHADDEVLGCGGALAKHHANGDECGVIFLADGVSSREGVNVTSVELEERSFAAKSAAEILGLKWVKNLGFPDNKLDSVPLLDIVQKVEQVLSGYQPTIVYTHHLSDLNVDHQVAYKVTMTVFRPLPGNQVKGIYCFEVRSSTEWASPLAGQTFIPNYYVDITESLPKKMVALKCYDDEMRDFPHSRSYQAVEMQAKLHGASVGFEAAEAFVVARILS